MLDDVETSQETAPLTPEEKLIEALERVYDDIDRISQHMARQGTMRTVGELRGILQVIDEELGR